MSSENKFTTPPIVFDLEEKIKKLEEENAELKEKLSKPDEKGEGE